VDVTTSVTHEEREIEFHDLINVARELFKPQETDSCETMAHNLASRLWGHYARPFKVSVFEDNECGATVEMEGLKGCHGTQNQPVTAEARPTQRGEGQAHASLIDRRHQCFGKPKGRILGTVQERPLSKNEWVTLRTG